MYNIRAEQEKDFSTIKKVNDLAFGQVSEARLVEAIRATSHFDPRISLVAKTDNGEIVGHILFSKVTIQTKDRNVPSLALAPMSVKPQYQQQGIGSTLVRNDLNLCQDSGYASVIV